MQEQALLLANAQGDTIVSIGLASLPAFFFPLALVTGLLNIHM